MKYALDSLVKVAAEPTHYGAKPFRVTPYGKEPAKLKPEDQKLLTQGVLRNEGVPGGVPAEKPTIYGLHDTSDAVRPTDKQGPPEAQPAGTSEKLPALGNYQRSFNKELSDEAGAAGQLSNAGYRAGLKSVLAAHETGLGRQTAEAKSLATPENVTVAGLNDTSDAVHPSPKQGPVAVNDVPAKFGIPSDKLGVDPTKLPAYAAMANKAQATDEAGKADVAKQVTANTASRTAQTEDAAKPLNRLTDWARGDSFIPGMNKGTAAGLGIGAAGLLAYLMTRDAEKKHKKVASQMGGHGITLPKPATTGHGLQVAPTGVPVPKPPSTLGKLGTIARNGVAPAAIAATGAAAGAGGTYAAMAPPAPVPGKSLGEKLGAGVDKAVGWAGEDSGLGVNKGTLTGIGVGAAGLLTYLLNRNKNDD